MKSQPPVSADAIRVAIADARSMKDAANALGTSRATLYRWLAFYGIPVERMLRVRADAAHT